MERHEDIRSGLFGGVGRVGSRQIGPSTVGPRTFDPSRLAQDLGKLNPGQSRPGQLDPRALLSTFWGGQLGPRSANTISFDEIYRIMQLLMTP